MRDSVDNHHFRLPVTCVKLKMMSAVYEGFSDYKFDEEMMKTLIL
jgi:hypothetical protein